MNLYTSLLVSLCTILSSTPVAAATEADESPESTIVLIESMEPGQSFQVSTEQQVRIPFTAIAGTSVSTKITGPAKIVSHNRIVPMKENTGPDGEKTLQPLIGTIEHEYLLQPTGPGAVTVKLTSHSPVPRVAPEVKTYHFTVE